MAKKIEGAILFENYYNHIFGQRWPKLKDALLSEKETTCLTTHLNEPYELDKASVIVAESLNAQPGMDVLDLCAAPGGKALVIAQAMRGNGSLTVNDRSTDRFFRLKRNMERLVTPFNTIVNFTKHDASRYSFYTEKQFDAILVDAPCSSEEHVLKKPSELSQWSEGRTKRLAISQVAILCQALALCKSGGVIIYSTCALSPLENDGVITKFLKKRPNQFTIDPTPMLGEKTVHGYHILPDQYKMGPLYYCRLLKS